MPDAAMRAALDKLPKVERELEATKALVDELKSELRIALIYTDQKYTLAGHYMRVMARFFS
jgi:hypothetical protein